MPTNRSAPGATVVPILVYDDVAKAIDWLTGAFGFAERLRVDHHGVVNHAQLVVGDGAIIICREGGPFRAPHGNEVSQYVHITVDDVDRHHEHARQFGARILQEPLDMPFGERQYTAQDHAGHWWTFSQHIADVAPEAWGARVASSQGRRATHPPMSVAEDDPHS
jgi:uncharacterized glyoxalase superfamily protein PhnB